MRCAKGNQEQACLRKIKYRTARDAKIANRTMKQARTAPNDLVPYKCSYCSGYHLGRLTK